MAKKLKVGLKKQAKKINLFNLSADSAFSELGESHINFIDNKKVIIDGCKSVIDYDENFVTLNLGKKIIYLFGSCFEILDFTDANITIVGKISKVEFGE